MSFILDALKKSENERQRQVGPSLADVRISRRANDKPWWVIAVAALLVVNLGVLMIVLNRGGEARPAPPSQGSPTQDSSTPAATSGPRTDARQSNGTRARSTEAYAQAPGRLSSNPAVRPLASEADPYGSYGGSYGAPGMPNPHLAAAAAVPDGPPMVRPIDAPTVAPLPSAPVFLSRTAQNDESLPLMSDIIAQGTQLPDLHLDIHVYSGNPAERFVFVNMRKYTEGQSLNEGPAVERITADGVVLNQHGVRFLLPRP